MSKEKPEVGDVWEFSSLDVKFLVYVIYTKDCVHAHYVTDEGEIVFFRKDIYDCKYLGKSKVSIKELFDVDKTNPCQNCNMTDEYCASECEE